MSDATIAPAGETAFPAGEHHGPLCRALLDGQFLNQGEPLFEALRPHEGYYRDFFNATFGYGLACATQYYALVDGRTEDRFGRNVCLLLAVVAHDLDREGLPLRDTLLYRRFEIAKWESSIAQSPWLPVLSSIKALATSDARRKFLRELARRRLVTMDGDRAFRWGGGVELFLEWVRGVGLGEEEMEKNDKTPGS